MEDQTIRLGLQITGQDAVVKLRDSTQNLKAQLDALSPAFVKGDISAKEFESSYRKLSTEIEKQTGLLGRLESSIGKTEAAVYEFADAFDVVAHKELAVDAAMEELERQATQTSGSLVRHGATLNHVADASANVSGKQSRLTQGMIQGSYAFQDFTAVGGDLGQKLNSVTNNLQAATVSLGPWGIAISAGVVAAVAIYRSWDSISSLWEDRRPITGQTESLDGLTRATDANKKAVDALREKGVLSLSQMVEFNKLTAEATELEKKLAEARETEANKKKLDDKSNDYAKGRAGAVQKAVAEAGGYEIVIKDLVRNEQDFRGTKGNEEEAAELTKSFEEILNKALKGDEKAISHVSGTTSSGIGKKNLLGNLIKNFDPAEIRKNERVWKSFDDAVDEQIKEGQAEDKANKFVDTLNEQGQENQRLMREGQAKEAADAKKTQDRAQKVQERDDEKAVKEYENLVKHAHQTQANQREQATKQEINAGTNHQLSPQALQAATEQSMMLQSQGMGVLQANQMAVMNLMNQLDVMGQEMEILKHRSHMMGNAITNGHNRMRSQQPRPF